MLRLHFRYLLLMALLLQIGSASFNTSFADMPQTSKTVEQPVAMLNLANQSTFTNLGIVEQLQTIRRLSQDTSPEAYQQLIAALSSNYPLARRAASKSLLEKSKNCSVAEKKQLAQALQPCSRYSDPLVQDNIVRLLASLEVPEAKQSLRSFAQSSDKETQLRAVDTLSQQPSSCKESLGVIEKYSPYTEVKQAAQQGL